MWLHNGLGHRHLAHFLYIFIRLNMTLKKNNCSLHMFVSQISLWQSLANKTCYHVKTLFLQSEALAMRD